ncbi:unnamed protein product, partial [Owenia fusiformis]
QMFKKQVNFKGTNVTQEIESTSPNKCAITCIQLPGCVAFDFGASDVRCHLLGNQVLEAAIDGYNVFLPMNEDGKGGDVVPLYYFTSQNYGSYGICAVVGNSYRSENVANCKEYFKILSPGLSGVDGTISIQSVKYPNRYWLASGMDAILYWEDITATNDQTAFNNNATFILHIDQWYTGCYTFESAEFPGYYVRHQGSIHKLHQMVASSLFYGDASFRPDSDGQFSVE